MSGFRQIFSLVTDTGVSILEFSTCRIAEILGSWWRGEGGNLLYTECIGLNSTCGRFDLNFDSKLFRGESVARQTVNFLSYHLLGTTGVG